MVEGLKLSRNIVLVLLISLVVAFAGFMMFGRTVKADETGNGWTLDDEGVLTITDGSAFTGGSFGWKADGVADQVKKVVIGDGIDKVPEGAFSKLTNLSTVELGDVSEVGVESFKDCTGLKAVTAHNLQVILQSAFDGCTQLATIDFGETSKVNKVYDKAFYKCKALTSINLENVTSIPTNCFRNCEALSDIKTGNVTSLGSYAFLGCTSLKTFDLSSVTIIPLSAFQGCEGLLKVNLSNATEIQRSAFSGCTSLYSVSSLANVTEISGNAFKNCTSLKGTLDMNSIQYVGDFAFAFASIEGVILSSDKNVSIDRNAFYYCENLTTVSTDKIVSVGEYAFMSCRNLTTIDLSHVKTIGNYAFGSCSKLETVDLRSEESMGDSAFKNSGIKVITVSKTFTYDSYFPCKQILERYFIGSMGQDPEQINDQIINGTYPNATLYYTEWDVGLYIDGKIEKLSVLKGEKFARPEDPAKDGFAFTGWYTDRACTKLYDFDKAVTDTLILYAGWAQDIGNQVFKGYTVTLGGQIGVNFYTIMPDNASKTDYIKFTVEGISGVQKVTVADAETVSLNGAKYDVFACRVPAKNMTSKITAELYIGGSKVATTDYSVRRYADQIVANPNMYINAWPLVRAMLNYGAYAQEYFNFKTDDLANAGINNSGYSIDDVSFSKPYDPRSSNLPDYLEFTGVSLTLESDTVLKLQFTKNIPIDLTYVFRLEENGTETILPYEVSGNDVIVRIKGISADRLDEDFLIRISVVEDNFGAQYFVTYSPMTYAYNVITREETAERNKALKNLMKAMYRYNEAAKNYKRF